MDVFEVFDDQGPAAGGSSAQAPADHPRTDPDEPRGRGRALLLAGVAAVAAVAALVGGAVAAARILVPDRGEECSQVELGRQQALVDLVQNTVAQNLGPGRTVRTLGCAEGGSAIGAETDLIDTDEVDRVRALLASVGCTLPDEVPATCTTEAGGTPISVEVVPASDEATSAYVMSVTTGSATST